MDGGGEGEEGETNGRGEVRERACGGEREEREEEGGLGREGCVGGKGERSKVTHPAIAQTNKRGLKLFCCYSPCTCSVQLHLLSIPCSIFLLSCNQINLSFINPSLSFSLLLSPPVSILLSPPLSSSLDPSLSFSLLLNPELHNSDRSEMLNDYNHTTDLARKYHAPLPSPLCSN